MAGDNVAVPIPRVDRDRSDPTNILGVTVHWITIQLQLRLVFLMAAIRGISLTRVLSGS